MLRVVGSSEAHGRRGLHPPIEPDVEGRLAVGDGHVLHFELCGHGGIPAVFLHGGPGGSVTPEHRRLFDPARFRVLLCDQRGCGRSTPAIGLTANTTPHLVSDLEALREMMGWSRWLVLGGSWGAALALAYAQAHAARVSGLVLRSPFTGRQSESKWLFEEGASALFPEEWHRFTALVEDRRSESVLAAYAKLLRAPERAVRLVAARAWCRWERAISTLMPRELDAEQVPGDDAILALAEIGVHYLAHGCFLEEGELLRNAESLAAMPGIIVQGRYDAVTPPRTAFELHRAWPGSELVLVSEAGHSGDPALLHHLLCALDRCADRIRPAQAGGD